MKIVQTRRRATPTAEIERVVHRRGHFAGRRCWHAELRQQPRQQARDHRAHADEETLHRVAGGALLNRQLVADEGAERLHRNVDRRIEDPQQPAAIHSAGEFGIANNASDARTAPTRKYGRRRPSPSTCDRTDTRRSAARSARSAARRSTASGCRPSTRRASGRCGWHSSSAARSRTGCRGSRSTCSRSARIRASVFRACWSLTPVLGRHNAMQSYSVDRARDNRKDCTGGPECFRRMNGAIRR